MMLVVDGQVQPREVTFQIKSGASYVSPTACGLPATVATSVSGLNMILLRSASSTTLPKNPLGE
jgi:hypothetical protein